MKRLYLAVFLFYSTFLSFSEKVDSVFLALDTIKEDTTKISYLILMANRKLEHSEEPQKAFKYLEYSKKLSKKNENYSYCYILQSYSEYYRVKSDYKKAYELINKALSCFKATNDKSSLAIAYSKSAIIKYMLGKYDEAIKNLVEAKKIFQELKKNNLIASTYNSIGVIYYELGEYDKSLENYKKALQIAKELKLNATISAIYNNIALIYKIKGNYEEALKVNFEALKLAKKLKAPEKIANLYNNIGVIYKLLGDYNKAISYYKKAKKIYEKIGSKEGVADQYNNIGMVFYTQGRINDAIEKIIKAAKIYAKIEKPKSLIMSKTNLAKCYIRQEEYGKAEESLKEAVKYSLQSGQKKELALSYLELGRIYLDKNDFDNALTYFVKSLNIFKSIGYKNGIADSYDLIGVIYLKKHEPLKALSFFIKGKKIYEKINNTSGLAKILLVIGESYYKAYKSTGDNIFLKRAEENALKSFEISSEKKILDVKMKVAKLLKEINVEKGSYFQAVKYSDEYEEIIDTINSIEKNKAIMELQAKYEVAEKEQKIKLQKEQLARIKAENERKQLQLSHERSLRIILLGSGSILLLLLLFIFKAYIDKSKLNKLLVSQSELIVEKNDKLNNLVEELTTQKNEMQRQKELLEVIHKELKESILYAEGLQLSLLPSLENFSNIFDEYFIFYRPKDVVSGDFYWCTLKNDKLFFSVSDCTGHGVPGAFMSMMGMTLLREMVEIREITLAAEILDNMKNEIIASFSKNSKHQNKDGIDMVLVVYDLKEKTFEIAGAYNGLYIVYNKEPEIVSGDKGKIVKFDNDISYDSFDLYEVKADRIPVGFYFSDKKFTSVKIKAEKGMNLYLFTDGFADQFGGPNNKKFKTQNLKSLLLRLHNYGMNEQNQILSKTFDEWKNGNPQIDDVTIMGVKV